MYLAIRACEEPSFSGAFHDEIAGGAFGTEEPLRLIRIHGVIGEM